MRHTIVLASPPPDDRDGGGYEMLRIVHSRPEETVLGLYIFEAAALGGVHVRASSHPVAASSVDQISTSYAVIGRWTNTKYGT